MKEADKDVEKYLIGFHFGVGELGGSEAILHGGIRVF